LDVLYSKTRAKDKPWIYHKFGCIYQRRISNANLRTIRLEKIMHGESEETAIDCLKYCTVGSDFKEPEQLAVPSKRLLSINAQSANNPASE